VALVIVALLLVVKLMLLLVWGAATVFGWAMVSASRGKGVKSVLGRHTARPHPTRTPPKRSNLRRRMRKEDTWKEEELKEKGNES
jgi:hypothetical protein